MLNPRRTQSGVTLIELAIGLVIIGILMAMAIPSFQQWIQNSQNRTAAESIQNGLRLARAEAVRRNAQVSFNLTDAGGQIIWNVGCVNVTADCPATIQSQPAPEGAASARAGIDTATPPSPVPANFYSVAVAPGTGLPAGVTFDGMGRKVGVGLTRVDITSTIDATARRLVAIVGTGGLIRMCDPLLSLATNPQGCS